MNYFNDMTYQAILPYSKDAARLLKAMGNPRRLAILCHLSSGEHSVTALCNLVGLSQSALSQHLAKLRREKLVLTRRDAQTVYYSIGSDNISRILTTILDIYVSKSRDKSRRPARSTQASTRAQTRAT